MAKNKHIQLTEEQKASMAAYKLAQYNLLTDEQKIQSDAADKIDWGTHKSGREISTNTDDQNLQRYDLYFDDCCKWKMPGR